MRFTDEARELLKRLEGCRLNAYRDQGGVWTIGYGHTREVRSGLVWTQEQADTALEKDVEHFTERVEALLLKHPPMNELNESQFSALVIFAFNVGLCALDGSTAMHRIRCGRIWDVPAELRRWNKIHDRSGVPVVSEILVKRREAEIALWLSNPEVA